MVRWSPSIWVKRAFASSACLRTSFGQAKHRGTESIAVNDKISFEHEYSHDATTILANCGSSGNSAIIEPNSVKSPSSAIAAKWFQCTH